MNHTNEATAATLSPTAPNRGAQPSPRETDRVAKKNNAPTRKPRKGIGIPINTSNIQGIG
jgi:hypothetical protein